MTAQWGRAHRGHVWHRLGVGGRSLCGLTPRIGMVQDALPEEAAVCGREECSFVNPMVCVCAVPDAHPRIDFGECKRCHRCPLVNFRILQKEVASW